MDFRQGLDGSIPLIDGPRIKPLWRYIEPSNSILGMLTRTWPILGHQVTGYRKKKASSQNGRLLACS
eukprot:856610-Pelagomonas_calceolata.AAC.1